MSFVAKTLAFVCIEVSLKYMPSCWMSSSGESVVLGGRKLNLPFVVTQGCHFTQAIIFKMVPTTFDQTPVVTSARPPHYGNKPLLCTHQTHCARFTRFWHQNEGYFRSCVKTPAWWRPGFDILLYRQSQNSSWLRYKHAIHRPTTQWGTYIGHLDAVAAKIVVPPSSGSKRGLSSLCLNKITQNHQIGTCHVENQSSCIACKPVWLAGSRRFLVRMFYAVSNISLSIGGKNAVSAPHFS